MARRRTATVGAVAAWEAAGHAAPPWAVGPEGRRRFEASVGVGEGVGGVGAGEDLEVPEVVWESGEERGEGSMEMDLDLFREADILYHELTEGKGDVIYEGLDVRGVAGIHISEAVEVVESLGKEVAEACGLQLLGKVVVDSTGLLVNGCVPVIIGYAKLQSYFFEGENPETKISYLHLKGRKNWLVRTELWSFGAWVKVEMELLEWKKYMRNYLMQKYAPGNRGTKA